jgi:tripartite-type tricarboxylate transporter receptor subunit TctC
MTFFRALLVSVLSLAAIQVAHAQSWPNRPIRIVAPFAPGGSTDITARLLAQRMQQALGQPVIVENRTGAGGQIAMDFVAKSAPDGYTFIVTAAGPHVIAPLLQKTAYDPLRDFVNVSNVNSNPQVLVGHPDLPAKNVRELIALAKAQPGKLNFSSAGAGSLIDLSALLFNHQAGVQIAVVPYKGGAPAVAAAVAGEVQATFANPSDAIPQVKAGKLRPLGVTSSTAFAPMPGVPTLAQGGLPEFSVETWNGVLAPVGTPQEIVTRASRVVQDMAKDPEIRERLSGMGMTAIGDTPEQFRAFTESQIRFWTKFVRDAGLKPQ